MSPSRHSRPRSFNDGQEEVKNLGAALVKLQERSCTTTISVPASVPPLPAVGLMADGLGWLRSSFSSSWSFNTPALSRFCVLFYFFYSTSQSPRIHGVSGPPAVPSPLWALRNSSDPQGL